MKEHKFHRGVIYEGDVLEVLRTLPGESVNTIITSPPYWGLRDYQAEGQIGLEPTLEEYLDRLLNVTAELKRVLRDDGVMFWNHGDSYGGSNGVGYKQTIEEKNRAIGGQEGNVSVKKTRGIKEAVPAKSMAMQNYRLAMRMVDEQGWILRNTIIWCLEGEEMQFVRRGNKYLHLPIRLLQKDDYVLTMGRNNDFQWVRVRNKFNNGQKSLLKITTKSGKEIVCSEEHRFPVEASNRYGKYLKLHFKKARELTERDYLWVDYKMPDVLLPGGTEDYSDGFVVGFFLAEGTYIKRVNGIYKDNPLSFASQKRWGRLEEPKTVYDGIQLSCGITDIERGYLDYFKKFDVTVKNYVGKSLSVYSRDKALLSLIKRFVEGELCDGKHFTQEVWNQTKQFIRGVVDGFLAGDGYNDVANSRWRVGIKPNDALKNDLELACRIVGYEFRYEGKRRTNYGTDAMFFVIRKEIKRKTFGFLYTDRIDSVEGVGMGDVYDIEVEPIYTSFCGKGKSYIPTKEERKKKWNNLYFLANGVWTHNSKLNHMPSSVKDRFTNSYEPVFFFVKNQKYWSDLDAVRVPHKVETWGLNRDGKYHGNARKNYGSALAQDPSDIKRRMAENINPLGKNPGDVWSLTMEPLPEAHFAHFPTKLIDPMVKFGCPPNGIVLDPFMGGGTTALVAAQHGCHFIGIELNPEYIEIAKRRIGNVANTKSLEEFI